MPWQKTIGTEEEDTILPSSSVTAASSAVSSAVVTLAFAGGVLLLPLPTQTSWAATSTTTTALTVDGIQRSQQQLQLPSQPASFPCPKSFTTPTLGIQNVVVPPVNNPSHQDTSFAGATNVNKPGRGDSINGGNYDNYTWIRSGESVGEEGGFTCWWDDEPGATTEG